jgi:hypothetical protein
MRKHPMFIKLKALCIVGAASQLRSAFIAAAEIAAGKPLPQKYFECLLAKYAQNDVGPAAVPTRLKRAQRTTLRWFHILR